MRNSKGQNVVEYILLVAAVVMVCIYFFSAKSGGPMVQAINGSLNSIVNQINGFNGAIQLQ